MGRSLFIIGGIGMILLMIAAIIYFPAYWLWYHGIFWIPSVPFWMMMVGFSSLMFVGLLLGGLGMFAYRQQYGVIMGLVSFILAVTFGWMLMVADILTLLGVLTGIWIPTPHPYNLDTLLWVLGFFFVGIILLLWGVTNILVRGHTRNLGLAIATGAMFIVAAIGFIGAIGALAPFIYLSDIHIFVLIGSVILVVPAILNAIILFTTPTEAA